jgi:hypothetical protein
MNAMDTTPKAEAEKTGEPEQPPQQEPEAPEPGTPEAVAAEPTAVEPPAVEPAAAEPAVPEPRTATEGDTGKTSKKARRAVRAKSPSGTKALVVWREGRVQYADDSVLVIDLDEAASADTDVHDVLDRLTELRDAAESAGRTETAAALGEIIQEKALN